MGKNGSFLTKMNAFKGLKELGSFRNCCRVHGRQPTQRRLCEFGGEAIKT